MSSYYQAAALSRIAHDGQVDKAGEDYFAAHVENVVRIVREELGGSARAEAVAFLHDTVEDTAVTLDDIEALFDKAMRDDIDALTRRDGEVYMHYIDRIKARGSRAVMVKHADLLDHIRRKQHISESLLTRYERALVRLIK
jgi:(p)ppGpp synthase/HD superfamily hydrolase